MTMCLLTTSTAFLSIIGLLAPCCAEELISYSDPPLEEAGDLLADLEQLLEGRGSRAPAEGRVAEWEELLRPTFSSLPRFGDGRLSASGARYLLHRGFVDVHGWFVKGLSSSAEGWNNSSPSAFFAEHAGAGGAGDARSSSLEGRIDSRGLSLRETAVFAATLENLVHEDATGRLHKSYGLAGLTDKEKGADESEVQQVIQTYMTLSMLGFDYDSTTAEEVDLVQEEFATNNAKSWNDMMKKATEVRNAITSAEAEPRKNFTTLTRVVEEVAERQGKWQAQECTELKGDLMARQKGSSARVLLRDFYEAALSGPFYYAESIDYLRSVGAIDETTMSQPSVIIPNYVNSPSNCYGSTRFYSVCCINECEALLKPLELEVAAPDALPNQVIEVVERLSSPTVVAPRVLNASLLARLEEIAAQSGGRVQLHGRLFAQWMHHAFPQECPFPHMSSAVKHRTGEEFEAAFAGKHVLNTAQLEAALDVFGPGTDGDEHCELPWSSEEELFIHMPTNTVHFADPALNSRGGFVVSLVRAGMMATAAVGLLATTLKLRRIQTKASGSSKSSPFFDMEKSLV